jgi:cytochrome c55X
MRATLLLALLAPGAAVAQTAGGALAASPPPERQQALVRLVRQDCGSCHGMKLTGGLGPPLTSAALNDRSVETLVATTLYGRPGTPMPAWKSMLSEEDANWIARQLRAGFPEEPRAAR